MNYNEWYWRSNTQKLFTVLFLLGLMEEHRKPCYTWQAIYEFKKRVGHGTN